MAQFFRKNVRMFQNGGTPADAAAPEAQAAPESQGMPQGAPAGAPAGPEQGGEDPVQKLKAMADEAVQTQNAQLAFQVCEIVSQVLAQQGGQGAPMSAAKGGILRRINGRATRIFC